MVSEIKAMLMQGAMCHSVAGKTWHSQTTEERQNRTTLLANMPVLKRSFPVRGKLLGLVQSHITNVKCHQHLTAPQRLSAEVDFLLHSLYDCSMTLWLIL